MTKDSEAYDEVVNAPHKAKLSHELLAAAASYEATKLWEDHQKKNGKEVSHDKAKKFLAAAAGTFITRMVETKGVDAFEAHKAKKHAAEHGGYTEAGYDN
ncbi:hypothetical protein JVT61DRAFT_882 [Boletus reticuloceps]|uniref:CipC1 protein n=1 Tax=Boletus reticuloceps TaxID=495285 RepID=A0A8I2YRK1_9AGAM|nr:hypothetical protein JVT61DRAFT_882 [Boletus reticuloceps]